MADPAKTRVVAWPARRKRADNPYTFLLQQSTAQHGVETTEFGPLPLLRSRWDIIHIHWPDMVLLRGGAFRQALTGAVLLAVLRVHRRLGARLVWTVHNLRPHEMRAPRVSNWFMNSFASLADGIISPSHAGLRLVIETYPQLASTPSVVVPIGSYGNEYGTPPTRAIARQALDFDDDHIVYLAFGMIREYKNLPHLAEQFSALDEPRARLVIAGPPKDPSEVERLHAIAASDARIRIVAERIDDQSVPDYFAAADHFVAPFKAILNSASLLLSLAHGCRAIVPAAGGLPEVEATVGAGWVTTFDGPFTTGHLAAAIASPLPSSPPDLSSYDWTEIGRRTACFFADVAKPAVSRHQVTGTA